jgi:hypothetical protein
MMAKYVVWIIFNENSSILLGVYAPGGASSHPPHPPLPSLPSAPIKSSGFIELVREREKNADLMRERKTQRGERK